ncbi:hypothetical protein B0J11DRAFT_243963 [Dendryphion nanum]|uniref:Uncharacterized protein n=1 Tax=Dendryphion nanum TaxID=256645 RepID=A0A9P9IPE3_9PLEO|nr:hypothetical protein B0J11DRAFT_243963 [Dendryphion nanum]
MSTLFTSEDVERQVVEEDTIITDMSHPFGIFGLEFHTERAKCLSARTSQCCFLCIQGKRSAQYAVRVPCFRPNKPRQVRHSTMKPDESGIWKLDKIVYESLDPKEKACESDATIYHRLGEVCFQQQGKWKKWVPFYGVVDVREVKFQFTGVVEKEGRFPVHIHPINVDEVRQKADDTIAQEPSHDFGENCDDYGYHSNACDIGMDVLSLPCIKDQINAARQQKKRLGCLHQLKDCVRDPWSANGLRTLEGIAQESFVIHNDEIVVPIHQEKYDCTEEFPGIQIILGWQLDRIVDEVPAAVAWMWFGVAAVWLFVIVWGGSTGSWQFSIALGQLLAASLAVLIIRVKG